MWFKGFVKFWLIFDALAESRLWSISVIPAYAGIQLIQDILDAGSSPA